MQLQNLKIPFFIFSVFILGSCKTQQNLPPELKPNIIFIYTDDQAPWALGLNGNDQLKTPNLDRIGKEGAYLPNFFTPTPVCSPTRASLITSRYSTETGITDWINPSWPKSLHGVEPEVGLDSKFPTWIQAFQNNGYRTGLIGKWHLGDNTDQRPEVFGYDYFMGFLGGGTAVVDPMLEENREEKKFTGFTTNILTDKALAFIKSNQQQPFFLSLHYRAPHSPWLPLPDEDWLPYQNLPVKFPHPFYPNLDTSRLRQMTREYYGSIAGIDRSVGKVISLLDSLGLSNNTIVIFTSDHGYNMGHNGIWHKGNGHWVVTSPPSGTDNIPEGQRPNMYDNSIKVPAMVKWPGKILPGTVVTESVTVLDWYPTLLKLAGIPMEEDLQIHGRNFLPLLRGEQSEGWDNNVFGQYSTHHQSRTDMRMFRTKEWKLVKDYKNPDRDELYNLTEDPDETNNLYSDPSIDSVKAFMTTMLVDKMKQINDPVLNDIK